MYVSGTEIQYILINVIGFLQWHLVSNCTVGGGHIYDCLNHRFLQHQQLYHILKALLDFLCARYLHVCTLVIVSAWNMLKLHHSEMFHCVFLSLEKPWFSLPLVSYHPSSDQGLPYYQNNGTVHQSNKRNIEMLAEYLKADLSHSPSPAIHLENLVLGGYSQQLILHQNPIYFNDYPSKKQNRKRCRVC